MIKLLDILREIEVLDPNTRKLILRQDSMDDEYIMDVKDNPIQSLPRNLNRMLWFYSNGIYRSYVDDYEYKYLISYFKTRNIKYEERRNVLDTITIEVPESYVKVITPNINEIEVLDPTEAKLNVYSFTSRDFIVSSKYNKGMDDTTRYGFGGNLLFQDEKNKYYFYHRNEANNKELYNYAKKHNLIDKEEGGIIYIKPNRINIITPNINEIEVLDPSGPIFPKDKKWIWIVDEKKLPIVKRALIQQGYKWASGRNIEDYDSELICIVGNYYDINNFPHIINGGYNIKDILTDDGFIQIKF